MLYFCVVFLEKIYIYICRHNTFPDNVTSTSSSISAELPLHWVAEVTEKTPGSYNIITEFLPS